MIDKNLIKQRFKKKLNSYNNNASIQKQMAEKLTEILPNNPYSSVLEIGCGTGFLTKLLNKNINYKDYTAIDIVPDCLEYISDIDHNIKFVCEDIEEFIKTDNKKYDLIISNAAFQWIENLSEFLTELINRLNFRGILLFSIFGKENFREIYYILGKTLKYYTKNEMTNKFSDYNIQIQEEIRIMSFKSPKDVLKHIQKTGVNALSEEVWTKQDLINFEKEYNAICANHPTLTYNPMYVLINNTP